MTLLSENMTRTRQDRVFFGRRMVWSRGWLGCLTILLQILISSLLVYALVVRSGDMVVSGCQKIGFHNFCLYNKTSLGCQCIPQAKDLSLIGITNPNILVLAIFLTYSATVISIMTILPMTFAHCFKEGNLWTLSLIFNVCSLIGLILGMVVFVYLTWDVFDFSQVSPGFLAIVAASSGMSVLCFMIRHNALLMRENAIPYILEYKSTGV